MTAAAARICRPTSLTDEILARRSAWTPPGIVVNGGSGFRQGLDDVERKPLGTLEQGVDPGLARRAAEDHPGEDRDVLPVEPTEADAGR